MNRKTLTGIYEPCFDGPIKAWTTKFCHRNLWRVVPALELEDLLQECHLRFLQCELTYTVGDAKHFMSLYQTAVKNRLNDLSSHRLPCIDVDCLEVLAQQAETDVADTVMMFHSMPPEVLKLMCELFNKPKPRNYTKPKPYTLGRRETNNEYYCRLIGADPDKTPLADMLNSVLRTS